MAKFYGKIGYAITGETKPGVWTDQIVEKDVIGDFLTNRWDIQPSGGVNDDLNSNHSVSVIMDPFMSENYQLIKYVRFMGVAWKVKTSELSYPRIKLTLGGEYNGKQT